MRTTLEIKDDLMATLQTRANEEHRSFKDVANEILALGLNRVAGTPATWFCPTHPMGQRAVNYDKALQLADELEALAVAEKLDLRK
jgi:hypothetical protein